MLQVQGSVLNNERGMLAGQRHAHATVVVLRFNSYWISQVSQILDQTSLWRCGDLPLRQWLWMPVL
jgi:hypothetical protein